MFCTLCQKQLKLINTRLRSLMIEKTLDTLLRILVEGPAVCDFPINEAVQLYYGQRKKDVYHSEICPSQVNLIHKFLYF